MKLVYIRRAHCVRIKNDFCWIEIDRHAMENALIMFQLGVFLKIGINSF